jgi:hypothetical protein
MFAHLEFIIRLERTSTVRLSRLPPPAPVLAALRVGVGYSSVSPKASRGRSQIAGRKCSEHSRSIAVGPDLIDTNCHGLDLLKSYHFALELFGLFRACPSPIFFAKADRAAAYLGATIG